MSVNVSNYESSYWYIYYKSNSSNIPTGHNCYASIYSQTTFFVHILSTFNSVVCESGYYGLNCNQECSMFCKKSRDCHPMSGYCKEGCKNGWQGLDCLEVSTLAMNEKNWKSAFSGILSAFCISLIFNTITIAYFIVKRIRNSTAKAKQLMMLQSDISEKGRKNDVLNVYTNETTASNYQELREFKTTETYDTPKDQINCN